MKTLAANLLKCCQSQSKKTELLTTSFGSCSTQSKRLTFNLSFKRRAVETIKIAVALFLPLLSKKNLRKLQQKIAEWFFKKSISPISSKAIDNNNILYQMLIFLSFDHTSKAVFAE